MPNEAEGIFRKNSSLESVLRETMRKDGVGIFERMIVNMEVRRMTDVQRGMLEKELGKSVTAAVEAGTLKLPVGAQLVGGVLVSGWTDLFDWFLENLPAILDMIMMIIALF